MDSKSSYHVGALWGMFYLALIMYPDLVASDCPRGCQTCNENDGSIKRIRVVTVRCLHSPWLNDIPANLPRNMRTLIFKSNAVKTIKTSSFQPYVYLQHLDLTNNGIEKIENSSFYNQRYLQSLDLKNNRLVNLTTEMFNGLYSLQKLILEKNHIALLPRGVFEKLVSIKLLDLHDNPILRIDDGAFDSLDYLREIHLSGGRLKKLGAGSFGNLMSLKTIDLSSNLIEDIDPNTFSCAPLLETLHVNDNSLREVPMIVLSHLKFLKDLDLSNNNLTYVRSNSFIQNNNLEIVNVSFSKLSFLQEGAFNGLTRLRHIYLHGNPLHCDCRLKWLVSLLNKSKDVFKESRRMTCGSPTHFSQKPLIDIPTSDLKCSCATCKQDAKCNSRDDACVLCQAGNLIGSCTCSHPLSDNNVSCNYYDSKCICGYGETVSTPKKWNCSFKMTNETCSPYASIQKRGPKILRCVCNPGFTGSGVNCSDLNECSFIINKCKALKMLCKNTFGSYSCYCPPGYRERNKVQCVDINECNNDPCVEQSDCYNTKGSFLCQCKDGFHNISNRCLPVPNSVQLTVNTVNSTAVFVSWSEITKNRDTVASITIIYHAFGTLSSEWTRAPEVYSPNTTQAVVGNLKPDTSYNIQVELNLIYGNITIKSDVEHFQTKEEFSKGKSSGSDGNKGVVIVTSSVVGSAVAIAIALTLVAFCLKRKKKTSDEGADNNRPYLQDLIEMRKMNREGQHENTEALSARLDIWEVPRDKIKVGEKIGEGQFGIVLKGTLTTNEGPIKVAIKTIKGVDRFEMKDFMQEMDMMKEIGHHPNVVSLLGVSSIGAPLYIITEYVDGGNLLGLLRSSRHSNDRYANMTSTLNSRELLRIALDVSKGMSHVALKKLVHRDLAARNVLMTTDLVAKIADFGLARDIYCEGKYVKTGGGRLPIKWMAPDAIRDQTYTIKSDVWSFGVLLWEIVTLGGSPYPGIPVNILLEKLLYGYRMPKPEHCSDEVYSIMEDCWALDPSQRPSFDDLCEALSLLLAGEGRTYINIRAIDAEEIAGSSAPKDETMTVLETNPENI